MFIGHFGVGFAAKRAAPQLSLGLLFVAAQFLDLLWPTLLLLGVERARIAPGDTAVTPLAFEHYPISHSLLAVAAWALLIGALYLWLRRDRRGAVVLALLVLSHWLLDAVVHRPDLPLYPNSATVVGLGLWNSMAATLVVELSVFAFGVWWYVRATQPIDASSRWGRWGLWGLVATLLLIQLSNLLGPPPPSMQAVAWVGQAQWLLVLWGYAVDKHRRVLGDPVLRASRP